MYKRKINILLIGIIVSIVLVTTFQTVSAAVTWTEYYDVTAGQAFVPATYEVPYGNTVRVTACSSTAGSHAQATFSWSDPSSTVVFTDKNVAVDVDICAPSQYALNQEGSWSVYVDFKTGNDHDTDTSANINVGPQVPEFPYGIAIVIFSSSLTYLMMRKGRKTR